MIDKKYFCYEIYKNLSICSTQDGVNYNPCSIYKGFIKKTKDVDIAEVWNSKEHLEIKSLVENDIPIPGCEVCYNEERNGRKSRRQSVAELYESFHQDVVLDLDSPQGLDYSVGNLCNLKCIICGPTQSTSWIKDYELIYPNKSTEKYKYKKNEQKLLENTEMLKNIKTLHIHGGGEPLLSDVHYQLLLKIKEAKGLHDLKLFYNVNGTVVPEDHLLEIWQECRTIELYFSIDDIGKRFDYQRTGAKWNQVTNNLEKIKTIMPHNHLFNINCVWSLLNLYYLDELYEWYENNFKTNRYGDPVNFTLQEVIGPCKVVSLRKDTKNLLKEKFKKYNFLVDLVESIPEDDSYTNTRFWNYINDLDRVRNADFKKICPEWYNLI